MSSDFTLNDQSIMAYSPKSGPPQQRGPLPTQMYINREPTAEPEPAPSLLHSALESFPPLAPVPEHFPAVVPAPPTPEARRSPLQGLGSKPAAKHEGAPPLLQAADPFATLDSLPSEPFATIDYEEMTKRQKHSAKQLVKDFVKAMVRGKQFSAVLPSGQTRPCFCALNRTLDKLQIRANERDKHGRTVPLQNIAEIVVGSDKSASAATEGLQTPLDDMSVTLVLDTEECITFRLEDIESRDKLAACLTMFSGQARTQGKK